ncbi:MAG: hypothetical protein WCH57_03905 [Verrucomicrobiota bacterium]
MKLICAWCKKVIRDGPEEPISHGICPECARRVTSARSEPPACQPSRWEEWMTGNFLLLLLLALFWLMAALFSQGLHFLSNGKIPRFIQWELPMSTPAPLPKPVPHHR